MPLNVSHNQIMYLIQAKQPEGSRRVLWYLDSKLQQHFPANVFSNRREIIPDHIDPFSTYPGLNSLTNVCFNNLKWRIFPLVICVLIHTASCGLWTFSLLLQLLCNWGNDLRLTVILLPLSHSADEKRNSMRVGQRQSAKALKCRNN